jgi:hypothetical protein
LTLHEPKTAAALLARVLPYFISTDGDTPDVASEAEIEVMLKELGLPVGLLEHMQVAPAPLDPGESDDPYGLKVPAGENDAKRSWNPKGALIPPKSSEKFQDFPWVRCFGGYSTGDQQIFWWSDDPYGRAMKIRNAVIITDASTELSMRIDELPDFSGNVVFSRLSLPKGLSAEIDRAFGRRVDTGKWQCPMAPEVDTVVTPRPEQFRYIKAIPVLTEKNARLARRSFEAFRRTIRPSMIWNPFVLRLTRELEHFGHTL